MEVLKVWTVSTIRIEPFPFFYVDYIAQDHQKLADWELAMLDHAPDEIINSKLITNVQYLDILDGYLIHRRTKVFDDDLKDFTKNLVRSLIDHLSFSLQYLPNNRINLNYCLEDTQVSDEVYSHRIKRELRDIRRRISKTLEERLLDGDDYVVEERQLPLQ